VRTADATRDPISSFLMVEGRTYDFPILPSAWTGSGAAVAAPSS